MYHSLTTHTAQPMLYTCFVHRCCATDLAHRAVATVVTHFELEHVPNEPEVVSDVNAAFGWCAAAKAKVINGSVLSPETLLTLVSDRVVSTSSAFSGVGAPEVSDGIVSSNMGRLIRELGVHDSARAPRPVCYNPVFCIEWNQVCQAELMALPHPPQHIFGNTTQYRTI